MLLKTSILAAALSTAFAAAQAQVVCVNCPADRAAFSAAAAKPGLAFSEQSLDGAVEGARLLVLQSSQTALTAEQQRNIEGFVRSGGSLLLALDERPGIAPFSLSFLLPTTAWRVNARSAQGTGPDGAIRAAEWDPRMFPANEPKGLALPFHIRIRPFDAVERGEGRYERYARTLPYLKTEAPAGHTFWTRPLLNRNWRVRLRGEGADQIPLLITGQYGAGKVAVFASSLGAGTPPFWAAVLRWLAAAEKPASAGTIRTEPPLVRVIEVRADEASHSVSITVANSGPADFRGIVLVRARTWEQAITGDFEQSVAVPAGASREVRLALPKPSNINYQSLSARDAYDLRAGVLTEDGSSLLAETSALLDFRPALDLSVRTNDLGSTPQLLFPSRMGMPVSNYAYRPGEAVTATVTIRNGLRNIAPLASVRDETNPSNNSAMALNDDAGIGEKRPIDGIRAYGAWVGQAGQENVLEFRFRSPVAIAAVTLIGSVERIRQHFRHNPGAVEIELDGLRVASAGSLDEAFTSGFGRTRIAFPSRKASVLRLKLPWVNALPEGGARQAPWLAEVLIDGVISSKAESGTVQVVLRDPLTGGSTAVGRKNVSLAAGSEEQIRFTVTPAVTDGAHYFVLEAGFAGRTNQAPFMVIQPERPLIPYHELRPPGAPNMGFIVTRGFRNVFDTATGTQEELGGWGQPDDLIYAYSRQLKQIGASARTAANRLYLSESDMRHYSTPWRSFPGGEYFYDLGAPQIVQRMKRNPNWNGSDVAILGHSDRWDTAPDADLLHGWQDFIDFDDYLRAQGQPGLKGKTRKDLAAEIHANYEHVWQYWHMNRYLRALNLLRTAFAAEGKKLLITAQGSPLMPMKFQEQVVSVLRGQSDDSTWGMTQESIPATTGREMGVMAFNPAWKMATLLQWNFDSSTLENTHWHAPVGTTEATRRHIYDRAFRGVIRPDGTYTSMHTYGFNTNAGAPYTMTGNDWQEWWRLAERHRLIAPDGPLGAGIVISTSRFADPKRASFSGGGGSGKSEADEQVRAVSSVVRAMHEAGVSISFSGNIEGLDKWTGNASLILLDLCEFSDAEIKMVAALVARGVRIAAFQGKGQLSDAAARLFRNPNTLLIPGPAAALAGMAAIDLAPRLQDKLGLPIRFPKGTSGYGFTSQGLRYIVLEDWREEGRPVQLRLLASPGKTTARAIDVNDNRPLATRREGGWWVIDAETRPGDGALICVREGL